MGQLRPKQRFGGQALLIALVFVVACVVSFMVVAIGFGHQG